MYGGRIMMEVKTSLLAGGMLFFPLEMIAAALLFSHPLRRREHFFPRLTLAMTLLAAMTAIVSGSAQGRWDQAQQQSAAGLSLVTLCWCVTLFLVGTTLVWALHNLRLREALYCAACAYIMEHLAYCARILLGLVIPEELLSAGTPLYYLVCGCVYALVYFCCARRVIQDGHLATTAQESLTLTLATLSLVMVMSIAASIFDFEIAHAVYASFCCVSLLYGQVKQQRQVKFQSELSLQRQMWSLHRTQYEMSRESIEIINRKCHDLKHQVAALRHIQDPQRKEEVLDSLQSSVMIYDAVAQTGNEILDTILTEKSLICGKHEIALSCIADGKQLAFLDPVDLYTLVGNAMDNAIEAVLPLPSAERFIRLRVQEKAGLVFLRLENPYQGDLQLRDGFPVTSKADQQNHGFGLKSIRDIGEKYQGVLSFSAEGGQFVLQIAFPICDQQFTA